MDALSWWHAARDSLQRFVLPYHCLLCGGVGDAGIDLCADCAAELPRNRRCCARCALPLAESAALCGQCQRRPPPWDAAWVPFRYAWPLDRLETRFKFGADLAAGRVLSTLWLREMPWAVPPELIVPVPLHRQRLRARGHNQALELARPLARAMQVPVQATWLLRERGTAAQTELGALARRRNVRRAFAAKAGVVWPEHVVLLDDVMTTGATLAECCRVLRRAGAKRIDVWALARAPVGQR
ncbi:ComF family protein [Dyella sp. EPa41]|uniref:ComF family protein n=1 Tax=Dyella sp. EPa41 TaxID=1561194 RepID=UPI001915A383|nr:ComF family protein [Dyella sp. EPa41]